MITLHGCGGRCSPLAKLFPGKHTFADMHAAIVYHAGFHYFVPAGLVNFSHAPTQKVVAQVAKVQGFIGIGAAVFHHYFLPVWCGKSIVFTCGFL